jgi:hypothetical protein
MSIDDLETCALRLKQCLDYAKRTESKVLVYIIQMALLELSEIQSTERPARHRAGRAKSREVQA